MSNQVNAGIASLQSKFESGKKSIESNLEISKIEKETQRLLEFKSARLFELGLLMHKALRDGASSFPDESVNLYNAIFAIDVQIKEFHEQIMKIRRSLNKDGVPCPKCSKLTPVSAKFCVHCGTLTTEETGGPTCGYCNATMSEADSYCSCCGYRVR